MGVNPLSSSPASDPSDVRWLAKADFSLLFAALSSRGYEIIGPTVTQGAIVYDRVNSVDDLPRGWTEVQGPGSYRLTRRDDDALFGFVVGPHSWKQFLFPASATMATAQLTSEGWQFETPTEPQPKYAFLGVRACEFAAIKVQDRVFLEGPYVDPIYAARRRQALIVAVNCTLAAPTCFCTSMNTGPRCRSGFDLALTELADGFTIESGSDAGKEILDGLTGQISSRQQLEAAEAARQKAVDQITRRLDTDGIRDLLLSNLEHPRWNEVAERCLSCTNCTMVCPTCFCSSVKEVADLQGDHVERRAAVGLVFQCRLQLYERRHRAQPDPLTLPPMAHPQAGLLDRSV